jgi:pimeloyl-ACP methyl ester carboxylesterase
MAKTAQSSSASALETSLSTDPHATDPALLRDHSQFKSYKTSRFEYPEIRVFRQHVKADQLPKKPAPLPLLVCIPGLGGSVAQFHPLLRSLVDLAPCLAIDWPGGGRSKFAPTQWEAYTSEALMELLEVIIEDHRDKEHGQGVVLIAWEQSCRRAWRTPSCRTRRLSPNMLSGWSPSVPCLDRWRNQRQN